MMAAMKLLILSVAALTLAEAQVRPPEPSTDVKLPNGRSQREEILKSDYKKALEDAAELLKTAEDLKAELERNDRHVLSVSSLKKTDEIEKLAKRIRSRLRRY